MLEERVLHALRGRLMDPALYRTFAEAFVTEWNHAQSDAAAERSAHEAELQRARQQIERLVDALANGMPPASVGVRLQQLEDRRLQLEAELAQAAPEAPRLHPALPELYRAKVADLVSVLGGEDGAAARDLVRGLVDRITLHLEADGHRVEVHGELAAILALSGAGGTHDNGPGVSAGAASVAAAVSEQVKMVAGTGFEPVTFRL